MEFSQKITGVSASVVLLDIFLRCELVIRLIHSFEYALRDILVLIAEVNIVVWVHHKHRLPVLQLHLQTYRNIT